MTAAKRTEYLARLDVDDRYRHLHVRVRGRISQFRVQLETRIDGLWCAVVRYDTAHGFAHRDLLDRKGRVVEKTPLFDQNYDEALTFAESDLKTSWEFYKHLFLKEVDYG